MRTIALRFTEKFAPCEGTVKAHEAMIERNGFVWYGKMGNPISQKTVEQILSNGEPRILLIHSGNVGRYWAYVEAIQYSKPKDEEFPEYYHDKAEHFKTWFKVKKFDQAPRNIMSDCKVASSGAILSMASKQSMSPYFIIDVLIE